MISIDIHFFLPVFKAAGQDGSWPVLGMQLGMQAYHQYTSPAPSPPENVKSWKHV